MSLRRAKDADSASRNSVFGYIRGNESNLSITVPIMIKYLCLNYYLLTDQWSAHGMGLRLDGNGMTVVHHQHGSDTVYGSISVGAFDESFAVYRWTFQIMNVRQYISIGLVLIKCHMNRNFAAKSRQSGLVYSCSFNGNMVYTNREPETLQRPDCKLEKGDHVTMVFNVVDGTLRFDVNGVDHGIILDAVRLEEKRYFMAVSFSDWTRLNQGEELMKLVDFRVEHY